MDEARCCIIAFKSTSLAMQAERAAKNKSIKARLATVPRQVSKDCTLGLRTSPENMEPLKKLFGELGIECKFATWG